MHRFHTSEDHVIDEWRPVLGYEGYYEVSRCGGVRSVDRTVRYGSSALRTHRGRELRTFRSPPTNYLTVSLYRDGGQTNRRLHTLVLEAFVGPRPMPDMDACHNNGDKDDNRVENLRWDTKSANAQDSLAHGSNAEAKKTHCYRGHEFTADNTYINPTSGGRQCRQCVRNARGHKPRKRARIKA